MGVWHCILLTKDTVDGLARSTCCIFILMMGCFPPERPRNRGGLYFKEDTVLFAPGGPAAGMISPNRKPQGFKGSMRSQMTLAIAESGMERNIPRIPQSAPPARTTMTEMRAFSLTLDATTFGMIK